MGKLIPRTFLDELISRIDIVDVVDELLPLRQVGRNFVARCPFHSEKTPSFSVSRDKQLFHCFGCGASGSVITFLMEFSQISFVAAVEQLSARCNMEIPRDEAIAQQPNGPTSELYAVMSEAARFYQRQLRRHPSASEAVSYLQRRGMDGVTAKRFAVGFAPPGWANLTQALGTSPHALKLLQDAGLVIASEKTGSYYDRFRDRIIFPILDQRGRPIGFGGRVIGAGEPKYLNSPESFLFQKGKELYGLYQAKQADRKLQRLFIVEGYMDVLAMSQFGLSGVVATLGTATTAEHITKLFRLVPSIVFCFDGDAAGARAAWRALEVSLSHLQDGRQVDFLFLPEGEDPDTLVRAKGPEYFRSGAATVPLSEFLIAELKKQSDVTTIEGRARFAALAKPLLKNVPSGTFRELLKSRIQEEVGVTLRRQGKSGSRVESPERRSLAAAGKPLRMQSLVRRLATLIVHFPMLAKGMQHPRRFLELEILGLPTLVEIVEIAQAESSLSCGQFLEHCRHTPFGELVQKLAAEEIILAADSNEGDSQIEREFDDAVRRLDAKLANSVLKKSRKEELHRRLNQE